MRCETGEHAVSHGSPRASRKPTGNSTLVAASALKGKPASCHANSSNTPSTPITTPIEHAVIRGRCRPPFLSSLPLSGFQRRCLWTHRCAGPLSFGTASPATWAARTTAARPQWSAHPATSSRSRPVRRGWRPGRCHLLTRGTALELMLKLLLLRNGKDDKHLHGLVGLSLALPKEVQESLSATYRDSLQRI